MGTGIATKAKSTGGVAAYLAGAFQVFTAPPGASVQSVSFDVGAIRLDDHWSVGIVAFDSNTDPGVLPYGCYAFRAGCGIGTPTFNHRTTVPLYHRSRFRFETRCGAPAGCPTTASGFSPGNRALFSAANVSVRVDDWTEPAVAPHSGALWRTGWHRGHEEAWTSYTDNVGIMVTRMTVDGEQRDVQDYRDGRWPAWVQCDFTRPRPCVDVVPGRLDLNTAALSDGTHRMRVEGVDAAGNVGGVTHDIHVDNHAPAKPNAMALEGGEGWRAVNDFTVRWSNPAGQVSPIARARYRLCEGSSCTEGSREGPDLESLPVKVSSPGAYTLRVWLEDAAGNHDAERASDGVNLRFDDAAPTAVFEASDPRDPLSVVASVADRGAGVVAGSIEARRVGEPVWRDLGARLGEGRLVGRLDDAALPDGTYEVRAHLRDGAGNERTADRRRDGSPDAGIPACPSGDADRARGAAALQAPARRPRALHAGPRAGARQRGHAPRRAARRRTARS